MQLTTADELVVAYAAFATGAGWSAASLKAFAELNSLSRADLEAWTLGGHRALARRWSELADEAMYSAAQGSAPLRLSEVFQLRFHQSRAFKRSVAKLAVSDARHPIDMIGRTLRTAELMVRLSRAGEGSPRRRPWLVARIVFAYCIAVLVWLIDPTDDDALALRVSRRILRGLALE